MPEPGESPSMPSEPISDLERSILARMVRQLRESDPGDHTRVAVCELEQLLQHYWWLMSHSDTVSAVAAAADTDRFTVAEVLSAAHRRLVERLRGIGEILEVSDAPTQSYQRDAGGAGA